MHSATFYLVYFYYYIIINIIILIKRGIQNWFLIKIGELTNLNTIKLKIKN